MDTMPRDIIEIIPEPEASRRTAFTEEDLNALREAKSRLEHPNLTAKISDMIGRPMESGFKMLPTRWHKTIGSAAETALLKGLEFSIKTMGQSAPRRSRDWLHKALAVGTGAVGGAVGVAALPVELPLSTCVMLRSIADIARAEEHDVSLLDVRLACLEVFALGGGTRSDDASESGYWMVRGVLSKYVSDAANHIAKKGFSDRSAPALVRLVTQIATRFGVVVSEQAAAQMIPIVGALTGGTVNYLFMDHFQDVAKGHFAVKRLEKKYGTALVRKAYEELVI
jgi:hypothetical protein